MPIGVADRDIVQNITQRQDESNDLKYILYKNATHPSRPEVPGVVRYIGIWFGIICGHVYTEANLLMIRRDNFK